MTAITGNTYPVRDRIKALGGRWDATSKAWMVPDHVADQARAIVTGGSATAATTARRINIDAGGHAARRRLQTKCRCCGATAASGARIYRCGDCQDCYEERKSGY